jgi:hypothetical protein
MWTRYNLIAVLLAAAMASPAAAATSDAWIE